MKRQTRLLAGIISMAAFTVSLVVGVRASMCAEVEMDAAVMSVETGGAFGLDATPEHDCMGHHGFDGMAHCPFTPPGGASSCSGAASLPATGLDVTFSPEDILLLLGFEGRPHQIVAATLFHPPKS